MVKLLRNRQHGTQYTVHITYSIVKVKQVVHFNNRRYYITQAL